MKIFKTLMLTAVGIVVVIVLVSAIVAATFDPNKYKPEIAAAVRDKPGRTLAIEGNFALTFFPSIGVAVGKASLSEPAGGGIFARFDEAKVSLALLPLFSRQVVIDRVTLSGLTADLVRRKAGRTNFDDLLNAPGRAAAAKREPKPAPQREVMHLDIAGIDIRSSAIAWRDESSGNRYKASVAEFKTGRIASGVPGKLSLSAKIEGIKPRASL